MIPRPAVGAGCQDLQRVGREIPGDQGTQRRPRQRLEIAGDQERKTERRDGGRFGGWQLEGETERQKAKEAHGETWGDRK